MEYRIAQTGGRWAVVRLVWRARGLACWELVILCASHGEAERIAQMEGLR